MIKLTPHIFSTTIILNNQLENHHQNFQVTSLKINVEKLILLSSSSIRNSSGTQNAKIHPSFSRHLRAILTDGGWLRQIYHSCGIYRLFIKYKRPNCEIRCRSRKVVRRPRRHFFLYFLANKASKKIWNKIAEEVRRTTGVEASTIFS